MPTTTPTTPTSAMPTMPTPTSIKLDKLPPVETLLRPAQPYRTPGVLKVRGTKLPAEVEELIEALFHFERGTLPPTPQLAQTLAGVLAEAAEDVRGMLQAEIERDPRVALVLADLRAYPALVGDTPAAPRYW